jgi:hypothetical protein
MFRYEEITAMESRDWKSFYFAASSFSTSEALNFAMLVRR